MNDGMSEKLVDFLLSFERAEIVSTLHVLMLAGMITEDDIKACGELVQAVKKQLLEETKQIIGFRCDCGGNVFTQNGYGEITCNGCLTEYEEVE